MLTFQISGRRGRGQSPGKGNSLCEIAKAGACLTCLKSSKGTSSKGTSLSQNRPRGERVLGDGSQDIIGN